MQVLGKIEPDALLRSLHVWFHFFEIWLPVPYQPWQDRIGILIEILNDEKKFLLRSRSVGLSELRVRTSQK